MLCVFQTCNIGKHVTPVEQLKLDLQHLEVTTSLDSPSTIETITVKGTRPTLGLIGKEHPELLDTVLLSTIQAGTTAHKIRCWKSRLRGAIIKSIDGTPICTTADIAHAVTAACNQSKAH